MKNETDYGRWNMNTSLGLLLAVSLALVGPAFVAADSPLPEATDNPQDTAAAQLRARIAVIDTQALNNLIERLDRAQRERNRTALLAIDRELKVVIAAAVRAGRGGFVLSEIPLGDVRAKPVGKKRVVGKRVRLSGDTRQVLHRAAFELRPLYGKEDRPSLDRKRKLMQRLADL